MKKIVSLIFCLSLFSAGSRGQTDPFEKLNYLIGNWHGTGGGFGNDKSNVESRFQFIMNRKYIEVTNESRFGPTEKKPEGEYHIDKGFISYDKSREVIVFRQFHIEGFVNQYFLVDSLSNDSLLVFETELIENFMPRGKAKWTIRKISDRGIETIFDVFTPGKGYTCYGKNILSKEQ